jgi:hypothetical protein
MPGDEQEKFAMETKFKRTHATSLGHFDAEIEPINIPTAEGMLIKNICQYVY